MLTKVKRDLPPQVSLLMLAMTVPYPAMNRLLTIGASLFLFVSLFVACTVAVNRATTSGMG